MFSVLRKSSTSSRTSQSSYAAQGYAAIRQQSEPDILGAVESSIQDEETPPRISGRRFKDDLFDDHEADSNAPRRSSQSSWAQARMVDTYVTMFLRIGNFRVCTFEG